MYNPSANEFIFIYKKRPQDELTNQSTLLLYWGRVCFLNNWFRWVFSHMTVYGLYFHCFFNFIFCKSFRRCFSISNQMLNIKLIVLNSLIIWCFMILVGWPLLFSASSISPAFPTNQFLFEFELLFWVI